VYRGRAGDHQPRWRVATGAVHAGQGSGGGRRGAERAVRDGRRLVECLGGGVSVVPAIGARTRGQTHGGGVCGMLV